MNQEKSRHTSTHFYVHLTFVFVHDFIPRCLYLLSLFLSLSIHTHLNEWERKNKTSLALLTTVFHFLNEDLFFEIDQKKSEGKNQPLLLV